MTVQLLGGEMLLFSDLDGRHGPGPVRGRALAPLLATARGRVLVAGPHDPELLDAVSADDLTLLVRGVPDAESLADRYAARRGVTVLCGGVDKLAADPPYDTVVALDGVDRLSSAEGAQLSWAESTAILRAALRPGGSLLLAVENHFGLHRLVSLPAAATDTDWVVAGRHDPTRPHNPAGADARLRDVGLRLERIYAAYPSPTEVTALLGTDLLDDDALRGFTEAALARACRSAGRVLRDPARLVVSAQRHGLAGHVAPAWLLLARRGEPAVVAPTVVAPTVVAPDAVIVAGGTRHDIAREPGGRWTRRADGHAVAASVPSGRTLEDLLLDACLRRDLPAVRELLRGWQTGPAAGVAAGQIVVGPDGGLTALEPAGAPAAALQELAATIMQGGPGHHPWPSPLDEADLAATLAAAAGLPAEPGVAGAQPGPPAEPGVAGAEPKPPAPPGMPGAGPDSPDETGLPDIRAFDELSAARDRLARELAEARAEARWYAQMLTRRDAELAEARHIMELLSDAGPARVGRALVGGARAARRTARTVVRRLRA